mgnify:CR=1 FL=1
MMSHKKIETNATLLLVLSFLVVTIGGLVQITPLFYLENTIEKVDGMRPYAPLELAGRNIYIREGCYVCHSQMIRPFRDEVERYGHYSLAAESMYDHPFQWGSKRTGPDLARIGGKYPDSWHYNHMLDPRIMSPGSIMPNYPWLFDNKLDTSLTATNATFTRAETQVQEPQSGLTIEPMDWYEIDFDKVNTIDDVKVILQSMGMKFNRLTFDSGFRR